MTDPQENNRASAQEELASIGQKSFAKLFSSCFFLSAFTFGGGYVIVPLMKQKFVQEMGWIDEDEMLALIAIAQTAPGPVAVNSSLMLGFEVLGWRGALTAIAGTVLPPFLLLMGISYFYHYLIASPLISAILAAMQAGVAAVIADVCFNMGMQFWHKQAYESLGIVLFAFVATFFLNFPIPLLIPLCALIGAGLGYYKERRRS
ncbi:MAG: chromate transporter [Eubacteriales bacterium]|nr:chromate transporter [Eubacteriales bacterium]